MKKALRLIALLIVLGVTVWWLAAGANRGWTKTSVPTTTVDEVTGIEAISYERRFIPGVEIVGAALLSAGALASLSFLFRSRPT